MTDFKEIIEDLGKSFDEFKAVNDTRLKEIEMKGVASADIDEKVDKMFQSLFYWKRLFWAKIIKIYFNFNRLNRLSKNDIFNLLIVIMPKKCFYAILEQH